MDSTLIQQEVIDEIAKENGVYEEVSKVTLEAMEGKLNFDEALKKRCELLKGISTETFERVYSRLQLNLGVEFFLKNRKNYLIKVAVLSGGFEPILQRFQREYRIEFFKANLLEEENQILTGKVLGEIINAEKKEKYLLEIAQKERIPLSQVVAIGDGSNDSLMLNRAGIGIGFHAKDGLKRKIQNWIEYFGMEILFFLFGSKT
jgi:phosphoserine phosphatase